VTLNAAKNLAVRGIGRNSNADSEHGSRDQTSCWPGLEVADAARVLIVSDNDSNTERLKITFREAGFGADSTNSMVTACEWAKSGRFQVIFSAPLLADGSWSA